MNKAHSTHCVVSSLQHIYMVNVLSLFLAQLKLSCLRPLVKLWAEVVEVCTCVSFLVSDLFFKTSLLSMMFAIGLCKYL